MQDQRDLRARLESALAEGQRLREEIRQLKAILQQHSIPLVDVSVPKSSGDRSLPAPTDVAQLGTLSDNQAKVVLFRSLFRVGRMFMPSYGAPRTVPGPIAPPGK